MTRTETTNDPAHIAAQPRMVSINTALQVDLSDQAGASHIDGRLYSGFGGQPDFVGGALHSSGGHAVIALRSWHEPSDSSTIVARLTDPATSFQHSAVITEQGGANIFGRSQRAQAELIIEHAANPEAREEPLEHAAALGLGARRAQAVMLRYRRTASTKNTRSIPVDHTSDCHTQLCVGSPCMSARTASIVMLTGWWLANGCSQLGIVATGTIAELANTSTKNGRMPATWAVSGSLVTSPIVTYTQEKQ